MDPVHVWLTLSTSSICLRKRYSVSWQCCFCHVQMICITQSYVNTLRGTVGIHKCTRTTACLLPVSCARPSYTKESCSREFLWFIVRVVTYKMRNEEIKKWRWIINAQRMCKRVIAVIDSCLSVCVCLLITNLAPVYDVRAKKWTYQKVFNLAISLKSSLFWVIACFLFRTAKQAAMCNCQY